MYARLAEAEDSAGTSSRRCRRREAHLQEENEIQQSIETLERTGAGALNDSLAVMEYRYELRQMSKFRFRPGLISAPRATPSGMSRRRCSRARPRTPGRP